MPADLSEDDRWKESALVRRPALFERRLEPGLERVLEVRRLLGPRIGDLRGHVAREVNRMVEEQGAETAAWPDRDRVMQVPVLLQLLETIGYPDVPGLADDLNNGFDMLGPLAQTLG